MSLRNEPCCWGWIAITAKDEKQAKAYRQQIDERLQNGFLPKSTKYAVVADPDGKRVGSGGAMLNVLRHIRENGGSSNENPFDGKILAIHSGGDSKRIPQYSACGKLFSYVPKMSPNGSYSTLFDELVASMSNVPPRIGNGMLTLSGDALLLFDPMQIDLRANGGAVALSAKESIETGVNHGVFLCGDENHVREFLHKQPKEFLEKMNAVDVNGRVDLDTGAIWFHSDILNDVFSLISTEGFTDNEKFGAYVSEDVRLSFYGDFLYPLAYGAKYGDYMTADGELPSNAKLLERREILWGILRKYKLSAIRLSPAKFIHFGTTSELHSLMTANVSAKQYAAINSFIDGSVSIGRNCYIEDCHIGKNTSIGENTILSNVTIDNAAIPSNVVIHGLKTENGKYIARIYGAKDDPKQSENGSFLCGTLFGFIEKSGLRRDEKRNLWNAEIYPVCDAEKEAVEQALTIYKISNGSVLGVELQKWRETSKTSLESSSNSADVDGIFERRKHLALRICAAMRLTM